MAELERTNAEHAREEIARLKGLKGALEIKASGMDKATEPGKSGQARCSAPAAARSAPVLWSRIRVIRTAAPAGSRFKGYETYTVQELVLSVHAVRYRRERWATPDGRTMVALLAQGNHGTLRPQPSSLRVDAVSPGPNHATAADSVVAYGRRVDIAARNSATVDREAGRLPRRKPRRAARGLGNIALDIGR